MARLPGKPGALPHLRIRPQKSGATYYYFDHGKRPRRETPLGNDYGVAVQRWRALTGLVDLPACAPPTLRQAVERYRQEIVARLPKAQRRALRQEIDALLSVLSRSVLTTATLRRRHVGMYLHLHQRRGAPLRLSTALRAFWRWCHREGYLHGAS